MFKTCSACRNVKPHSEFYKWSRSADGLQAACKVCQRDQRRASRRIAAAPNKPPKPSDLPGERWLPVVGYEGLYSISDVGRFRSEERFVDKADGTTQLVHARILSPASDRKGYLYVNLFRDNKGRTVYAHQAVMAAFVGPLPKGMDTRHLNGNCVDNRLENLAYGTRSENHQDTVRHGRNHNANKTHCPRGHEYNEENTYWMKRKKGRICRKCLKLRTQARSLGRPA